MNDCVAPPPEADRNRVTAGDPWALESAMYELKVIRERRLGAPPRRVLRAETRKSSGALISTLRNSFVLSGPLPSIG